MDLILSDLHANLHALRGVLRYANRRSIQRFVILGDLVGRPVEVESGFAEMEFGDWDGLTFAEVAERHRSDLDAWLGSLDAPPGGGGESFRVVERRVLEGLQRVIDAYPGRTVLVVSHVTPIKTLVAHALEAPLQSVFRMELAPAAVSVVSFFAGGEDGARPMASLRLFNGRPTDDVFQAGLR